jgi:hypothetical protein
MNLNSKKFIFNDKASFSTMQLRRIKSGKLKSNNTVAMMAAELQVLYEI